MNKTSTLFDFKKNGTHEIAITTLSLEQFNQLPHMAKTTELDDLELYEQNRAAILATTDITEDEFEELTAPDFNTLSQAVINLVTTRSDELTAKPLEPNCFEFDLLFPFTNEVGEQISRISFSVPKTRHSKALAGLKDKQEREDFMFRAVCELDKEDLQKMAVNDYLTLKPRVGDFFLQSGAYFQKKTLNA
ncbi:phage tail assembly protein [Vibrio splendidus]|uniref:phage tail assembly protein n=1 Tax=Vibrio splendidus TaxID=29497 RepID=UPI000C8605AE|nr:phage tail assembly protein [Vibrio splendidus]PMI49577.1 hypothetical protein BCU42_14380 [Vibrio splendidus]